MTALHPVYRALEHGDWIAARTACRDLLDRAPDDAAAHHAIGLSFCGEEAFADAVPHFVRARDLDPANPRWARDLGSVYGRLRRWADVVEVLEPVVDQLASDALALYLTAAGQAGSAQRALERMAQRRTTGLPMDAHFLCAHGVALYHAKRFAEAEAVLQSCLARYPDTVDAHEALSVVYEELKQAQRALDHARALVRLRPHSPHVRIRLALACSERGHWAEARAERQQAERLGLTPEGHSVSMFVILSDPLETGDSLAEAARIGFATLPPAPPRGRGPAGQAAARGRRLRVGYISGECRSTPSYYFYRPFIPHHDRSSIEVFLYATNTLRDHVTRIYRGWPEHWRDCAALHEAALAATVRADDLDVLVDLSGHFIFNRLWVLAGRLAPVQASYPNFPGTTGCPAMDYFLSDPWTSPAGTDSQYTERLHRLSGGYLKYAPPDDGPAVGPLPMERNGYPTFGVFQRLSKFNDGVWDAIAAVLAAVPDARLLIQNGDHEFDAPHTDTSRHIRRHVESRGIDWRRVTLKGPLPHLEHLAVTSTVDVALDTFPYAGQTTTCESLWMGVPVVTLPGDTHVSRVGISLLARAGHADWIAASREAYVSIAASLVSDAARLGRIRHRLRQDFIDGGLTDGVSLARELEAAYHAFTFAPN